MDDIRLLYRPVYRPDYTVCFIIVLLPIDFISNSTINTVIGNTN